MSARPDVSSLTLSQLEELQHTTKQQITERKQSQLKDKLEYYTDKYGYYVESSCQIEAELLKFLTKNLLRIKIAFYYDAHTYSTNIDLDNEDIIIDCLQDRSDGSEYRKCGSYILAKYLIIKAPCLEGCRLSSVKYRSNIHHFNTYNGNSPTKGTIYINRYVYFKKQPFPSNNKVVIIMEEQEKPLTDFTIINGEIIGDDGENYGDYDDWDRGIIDYSNTWITGVY